MLDIFVFGSNLAGRHGRGAALCAVREHGAIYGQGVGPQGQSYGVPTKGHRLEVLRLPVIHLHVLAFKEYVHANPQLTFNVTRIGCGLAGYADADIAPMFTNSPSNAKLPESWRQYT